jgi:ABC-type uncharacterized transport system fused permease/ATPase subunit
MSHEQQPILKFNKLFFKDFWQLFKPFWVSKEKNKALGMLILNIGCIDKKRIFSILYDEREFFSTLRMQAKIVYPFKIIFRYIKLKIADREVAKFIAEWI